MLERGESSLEASCPVCKRKFQTGEIPPLMHKLLGNLRFHCPNSGCSLIVEYWHFGEHVRECPFSSMPL